MKTRTPQKLISLATVLTCLAFLLIFTSTKPAGSMSTYSLLALGDSYTIGEMVRSDQNFPSQTVELLKKAGYDFGDAEILATTGWTTDELQQAINDHDLKSRYDFVTLLIGVNNQYRGRTVENYKPEFESILKQAIKFSGDKPGHVIVLSIPDWGVTPFAKDRDQEKIAKEIDDYNLANKEIASKFLVNYIDITPGTREAATDLTLLATDGLHPSAKEYSRWAEKVSTTIQQKLHQ